MTASAARRQRATRIGALLVSAAVVAVVAVSVLAVATLRSSREGRAPTVDARPVLAYPATPNALVGVVDDMDRLTSLVVATLDPAGVGGSLVVVPVNVDASNGIGVERRPISARPFSPGDEGQAVELVAELEPLITSTIERGVVLGPEELADVLGPVAPLAVDLPEDVIDADAPGDGVVAPAGASELDVDQLVEAFTAIPVGDASYDRHDIDVALWRAVAAAAPVAGGGGPVPTDDAGRPVPPTSVDELLQRLLAGEVGVRDLAINTGARVENETGADFVILDRVDALVVFASISPDLVSTPNDSLAFRLVVGFDDEQIAELGRDASGVEVTREVLVRRIVSELLFAGANVVAVDLAPAPDGVPDVTRVEVAQDAYVDGVGPIIDALFGDAEIEVASELVVETDVVVTLGADFLEDRRADLVAAGTPAASDPATSDPTTTDPATSDPATSDPAATDPAGAGSEGPASESTSTGDTVVADG